MDNPKPLPVQAFALLHIMQIPKLDCAFFHVQHTTSNLTTVNFALAYVLAVQISMEIQIVVTVKAHAQMDSIDIPF